LSQGINKFLDRTEAELKAYRGVDKAALNARKGVTNAFQLPWNAGAARNSVACAPVPDVFTTCDWRTHNVVTAVKDQGGCGSCWAFAAIETLESAWALANGQLEDLSEQQMLDCSTNPQQCGGTGGCGGSTPEIGWASFAAAGGGVASEFSYPYTSYRGDAQECKYDGNRPVANVTGYVRLPENSQEAVMDSLSFIGPLAVNMDASKWFLYDSGVFTGCPGEGEDVDIDHALELVGFGTDEATNIPYWLVRNR